MWWWGGGRGGGSACGGAVQANGTCGCTAATLGASASACGAAATAASAATSGSSTEAASHSRRDDWWRQLVGEQLDHRGGAGGGRPVPVGWPQVGGAIRPNAVAPDPDGEDRQCRCAVAALLAVAGQPRGACRGELDCGADPRQQGAKAIPVRAPRGAERSREAWLRSAVCRLQSAWLVLGEDSHRCSHVSSLLAFGTLVPLLMRISILFQVGRLPRSHTGLCGIARLATGVADILLVFVVRCTAHCCRASGAGCMISVYRVASCHAVVLEMEWVGRRFVVSHSTEIKPSLCFVCAFSSTIHAVFEDNNVITHVYALPRATDGDGANNGRAVEGKLDDGVIGVGV